MAAYQESGQELAQGDPQSNEECETLASRSTVSHPVQHICDIVIFFLVTVTLAADIITDLSVLVIYGLRQHTMFLTFGIIFMVMSSVVSGTMYALQLKAHTTREWKYVALSFFLNIPLQLTIVGHRFVHFVKLCRKTPNEVIPLAADRRHWLFVHLKLAQSVFQSTPHLVLNLLHMLNYNLVHIVQYISVAVSFISIILGMCLHEQNRKERGRGTRLGLTQLGCVFAYKTLILGSRLLAMVNFAYCYGSWIMALLMTHFTIVLSFSIYFYRYEWKVDYHKLVLHSFYCVLCYVPIHSEYRPEGETVLYYSLFLAGNALMVLLPYGVAPSQDIHYHYAQGSPYYVALTLVILLGSALGICIMSIYYFVFHTSSQTVRNNHFTWFSRLCQWSLKPSERRDNRRDPRDTVRLYVGEEQMLPSNLQPDDDIMVNTPESAQLSLRSPLDENPSVSQIWTDSSANIESCSRSSMFDTSFSKTSLLDSRPSLLGSSDSKHNFSDPDLDSASRPSVLEGEDDESDNGSVHDTKPLHLVV